MVPGSTFRYGSNFMGLRYSARLSRRRRVEAEASPFPREDTTPPVTKRYFADMSSSPLNADWVFGGRLPGAHGNYKLGRGSCRGAQPIMAEKSGEAKSKPEPIGTSEHREIGTSDNLPNLQVRWFVDVPITRFPIEIKSSMRKIILACGISLDGYIARPDGSVDFLFMPKDFSMAPFFKTIDVMLMGRKTYDVAMKMGGL